MIESLDVILWDKKVGTLVANREGHRSKACFYFDSDYVRNGYDIAPLRAPVKGVAAQRGLPVYPDEERLFGGLPSFIADSLPGQLVEIGDLDLERCLQFLGSGRDELQCPHATPSDIGETVEGGQVPHTDMMHFGKLRN